MKKSNLITIFILLSLLLTDGFCDASKEKRVVYDVTTDSISTIEKRLIGSIIANHEYYHSKLQEYKVKVIIHGKAYKFFMKDLNNTAYAFDKKLLAKKSELGKRLKSLVKLYGVEFDVCAVGMKRRELNPKSFYLFTAVVHNAIIGLVDAQNDGYAYVPID